MEARQPLDDKPIERVLSKTDARQGDRSNVTRKVLTWGLVLVVIAFAVAYYWQHLSGAA